MTFLPIASHGLRSLLLPLPGSGWEQLSNCRFIFSRHPPLILPAPALLPLSSRRTKRMVYHLDFLLNCWHFFFFE